MSLAANICFVVAPLMMSIALAGCQQSALETAGPDTAISPSLPADVDWLQHGQDSFEQRFSRLADINADNVSRLGLAWYFDYPTNRGLEATPLVRDGVIYSTGSWSMVYAHDALSGELLWMYDPQVPREWAVHLCCDVVNRGVALRDERLFFGTLDGRLLALEATTGKVLWETQTTDVSRPYSITGAPRLVGDKVVIGNGGSELGVRGYVSAYAMDTGELVWRFYTVPGNPAQRPESPAMARATETWQGGEWWRYGGGGTVWDSMAYDPALNLLYIGVGNGAPWNREIRSPGGGDNLFLSSIVALNPDDGSYVWHYQTTPGESWDYTATQHMILAELTIDGRKRDVIMQAPKNGFFYVLDRATGELISAEAYTTVTWATNVDIDSGRPVEAEGARYVENATGLQFPGPIGGHNWHPMSYHPETGLVYIPAQDVPWVYAQDKDFEYRKGYWNTGTDNTVAMLPDSPLERQAVLDSVAGHISAWDPIAQQERWRVTHPGPWNGGILSTAGNLVMQGNSSGELVAYRADTGERLWSFDAQTGVVAPPVSFRANGTQYIAVLAGWGGSLPLVGGEVLRTATNPNRSRLLVFKLDGTQKLPAAQPLQKTFNPPPASATAADIAAGKLLFSRYCMMCHGDGAVSNHVTPDLRAATPETFANWLAIVLGGLHWQQGMVGFADQLTPEQAMQIQHYVIERSHFALRTSQ